MKRLKPVLPLLNFGNGTEFKYKKKNYLIHIRHNANMAMFDMKNVYHVLHLTLA